MGRSYHPDPNGRDKRKMYAQDNSYAAWRNPLPEFNTATCPRRHTDGSKRQQSQHGAPDMDGLQKFLCRLTDVPTDPVLDCGAPDRQRRDACDEDQKIAKPGLKFERLDQHDQPQEAQYR